MKTILFQLILFSCNMAYAGPFIDDAAVINSYRYYSPVKETDMDIAARDGIKLKATYYSPGKPGPGIILLHQCNMDRKCWQTFASALAQHGMHVITFDYRGYGETPAIGGNENLASDIDAVLAALTSQPGVDRNNLAAGGASCGVNNAVMLAKRSEKIKALMLLSGPVSKEGLKYLQETNGLAIFGAASSEEDFAVKAVREMVSTSKNPSSIMNELHNAGHGAPMFAAEPAFLQKATDWVVKVLK
jgi:pimeloyl-ACP methyl ester carboxylesterase